MLLIILVFWVVLFCFFTFRVANHFSFLGCPILFLYVPCCAARYDFRIKTMFSSSLSPVVCRRAHVLFMLFVFVWFVLAASYLWEGRMFYLCYLCLSAYSGVQQILCCASVVFLRLVYPMLPVSLDCPLLVVPSVFSNVY